MKPIMVVMAIPADVPAAHTAAPIQVPIPAAPIPVAHIPVAQRTAQRTVAQRTGHRTPAAVDTPAAAVDTPAVAVDIPHTGNL